MYYDNITIKLDLIAYQRFDLFTQLRTFRREDIHEKYLVVEEPINVATQG